MDKEHWLSCTDPTPMLEFLRGRGMLSARKARLFAVACCRRIWHLLTDERSRRAVEVADRYADGSCGEAKLQDASRAAWAADNDSPTEAAAYAAQAEEVPVVAGDRAPEVMWVWSAAEAGANNGSIAAARALACVEADTKETVGEVWSRAWEVAWHAERDVQAALLRDLLGPLPLSPLPPLDPSLLDWHGGAIVRLAESVYDDRQLPSGHLDAARLAVLADMLEEGGCCDPALLGHLRGPGPHVRGCHSLDLLLGKS